MIGSSGWLLSQKQVGTEAGKYAAQDKSPPIALLPSTVGEGVFHKLNHSGSVTCGREHKGCGGFPSVLIGGRSSQTIWLQFWKCPFMLIS